MRTNYNVSPNQDLQIVTLCKFKLISHNKIKTCTMIKAAVKNFNKRIQTKIVYDVRKKLWREIPQTMELL